MIEDKFANGWPPLERLGVQFVPDVTPYETMKLRLLNAGHSVLGFPGAIHGHPTIDACMRDPVFATFLRRFLDMEVTPTLGTIEGIDIEAYKDSLAVRFANPNIKDGVSRICSESAAKLPKFLMPTLRDNLANDGPIQHATFILAAWCYYSDRQTNERDEALNIMDAQSAALHEAAKGTTKDWTAFLRQPELFGDLVEHPRFVEAYTELVQRVYAAGDVRGVMSGLE